MVSTAAFLFTLRRSIISTSLPNGASVHASGMELISVFYVGYLHSQENTSVLGHSPPEILTSGYPYGFQAAFYKEGCGLHIFIRCMPLTLLLGRKQRDSGAHILPLTGPIELVHTSLPVILVSKNSQFLFKG